MMSNNVEVTHDDASSSDQQQQSSSGCESGWTLYLEHSTQYLQHSHKNHRDMILPCDEEDHENDGFYSDDEEEDLSMVSDASSGPPHFDHDLDDDEMEDEVFCYNSGRKAKSIKLTHHYSNKVDDFSLDDTASSIIITSKKNGGICGVEDQGSSLESLIDYSSQGFSATHFQGRSTHFQERYGILHESPLSAQQFQPNQWW